MNAAVPLPDEAIADFDFDLADGTLLAVDRAGRRHRLPGIEGYRIMEILRDCGLDVPATCGGACACGTCHVYVAPDWVGKLPPPREEEEAKLDDLVHLRPGSRLACQLIWEKARMDGLELALAPLEDA